LGNGIPRGDGFAAKAFLPITTHGRAQNKIRFAYVLFLPGRSWLILTRKHDMIGIMLNPTLTG
jgi:hypothetical protein